MSKSGTETRIDEYGDAQTGGRIGGLPDWRPRELTGEYTEEKEKRPGVDVPFLVLTMLILVIGLIMALSASFARGYYTNAEPTRAFIRQLIFAVSGVAIMFLTTKFSIRSISRGSYPLLIVSIVLLVAVLYVGIEANGAKRWLGFEGAGGSFSFQPSEVAKLALILSFAKWTNSHSREQMAKLKYGVFPFIAITALIIWLLILEPHLSASIIIILLAVIMMFAGGTGMRWFVLGGLAIAAAAGILLFAGPHSLSGEAGAPTAAEQISQLAPGGKYEYAGGRLGAWLDPDSDPLGNGFQIRQSLNAVGSGGLLGQGLGQSRQKHLYLPEEHNDYIFAIVCEELGFIGAMLILMLFALLIVRGFWLALHAKDHYSALITTGITSLLAIQVFLNVAVVTNLIPATGISLPFFSSGGTALWIQLFQIGILLAVSREIPPYRKTEAEAG